VAGKLSDHELTSSIEEPLWELFHENSKTNRHDLPVSDEEVVARMGIMWESLPFAGYNTVELPKQLTPVKLPLGEAITSRLTPRCMEACTLTLENIATILHYASGITRDNKDTSFPRPFRTTPSAGALYPLELFFHSSHVNGLNPGLYHYNPSRNHLRLLREGDATPSFAKTLVQTSIAFESSALIFITAVFARTTFKYKDRGYRFVLLEAGHVAQNINLTCTGLGLGCINIGGYFDRQVDELLAIDGLAHSTVYVAAIGKGFDDLSAHGALS
jgi:SagB-type dehydrogenase family enzyme